MPPSDSVHKPLRIGIVAGEASGDILASGLIQAIKAKYPDAVFEGIAGPQMQALGCHSLFNMEELSVMGLVEVLSRIRRLLHIRKTLVEHFLQNPPDVFIGVDAPDFNIGLEARLKKKGIKTVHYVSPSVWAWREKRIYKIAKATNLVLSLLPFEKAFYDKHQVPCTFVGHTLADEMPLASQHKIARQKLDIESNARVLALLPGSRAGEVRMLLDDFVKTAELLDGELDNFVALIPVVNRPRKQQIEAYLEQHKPKANIRIVIGHSRDVMSAADAILLASGTAALEAMLCKKPMVVAYKFKPLTFMLAKRLVKTPYVSIPNLLANKPLVPELLQDEVEPENLLKHLLPMFKQDNQQLVEQFTHLHQIIKQDADQKAADAVLGVIDGKL